MVGGEANMTFRKSNTHLATEEVIGGLRKMNLRNVMEEPEHYGFNRERLINGESVTQVETMYDTIDR